MNAKVSSMLDKAGQDRSRSNFDKALSRLEDGIKKHPKALSLYTEAVDVAMEAGESLKALQYFKQAQKRLPDDLFELWTFAADKVGKYNDPIVGRYLVEQAIRNGEVETASSLLADLKDHTADELLQRVRTKKQAMSSAIGGGLAARDEFLLYAITEALLCVRLSRFPEAMNGVIRILDENPDAHKLIEPFLVHIEKHHKEKGESVFALGCCFFAANKYETGIEKLIRASKMTPALMPDAIERIESLGDQAGIPADKRDLLLAEMHLAHKNAERAEDLLRGILDRDPAKATPVVELLETHVLDIGDDLNLHFLFIDAALGLGRKDTAISHLKKIFQKQNHRNNLLAWLEERTQVPGTDSGILLFFGEAALNEGMHGKALEIFKEILSHGIQDEPTIKELLSRHQSTPLIRHFFNDRFGTATVRESASNTQFENYDDFDLAEARWGGDSQSIPASRPTTTIKQVETHIDTAGISPDKQETAPPKNKDNMDLGIDNREFSLGGLMDPDSEARQPEFDEKSAESESAGDGDDLFDYLSKNFTSTDEPEDSFAVADDVPCDTPLDTASGFEFAPSDEIVEFSPEISAQTEEEDIDESPKDFETLFKMFSEGRIDNGGAIELIEQALCEGRLEEMKTVLAFTPANIGEDMTRRRLLADYYLETEQPLSALITLKSININGLARDERKVHLTRIAICYRALHNFEAAHSVFLRLLSEQPGAADVERMAESNYEQYLQSATGSAPALEKVSSI